MITEYHWRAAHDSIQMLMGTPSYADSRDDQDMVTAAVHFLLESEIQYSKGNTQKSLYYAKECRDCLTSLSPGMYGTEFNAALIDSVALHTTLELLTEISNERQTS